MTSKNRYGKNQLPKILKKLIASDPLFRTTYDKVNYSAAARMLNIHQPTLQRILDGSSQSPRRENVVSICEYFNITESQLYGDTSLEGDSNSIPSVNLIRRIPIVGNTHQGVDKDWLENGKPDEYGNHYVDFKPLTLDMYALEISGDECPGYGYAGDTLLIDPQGDPTEFLAVVVKDQKCVIGKLEDFGDRYRLKRLTGGSVILGKNNTEILSVFLIAPFERTIHQIGVKINVT